MLERNSGAGFPTETLVQIAARAGLYIGLEDGPHTTVGKSELIRVHRRALAEIADLSEHRRLAAGFAVWLFLRPPEAQPHCLAGRWVQVGDRAWWHVGEARAASIGPVVVRTAFDRLTVLGIQAQQPSGAWIDKRAHSPDMTDAGTWEAFVPTQDEVASNELKSALICHLLRNAEAGAWGVSQVEIAARLGAQQPQYSDLRAGRGIYEHALSRLLEMVERGGELDGFRVGPDLSTKNWTLPETTDDSWEPFG